MYRADEHPVRDLADTVYVLEVNPRASRTVPFVSKATGVPLAKIAARLMIGRKLAEFNLPDELRVDRFYIKTPVFPFVKFPGVDPVLGPEMRSTGEVMGVAEGFGGAFLKAQQGAEQSYREREQCSSASTIRTKGGSRACARSARNGIQVSVHPRNAKEPRVSGAAV